MTINIPNSIPSSTSSVMKKQQETSSPRDIQTEKQKEIAAKYAAKKEQDLAAHQKMKARIREVGIHQYTQDQLEMKRLAERLERMKMLYPYLEEDISRLQEQFAENPPATAQEMIDTMYSYLQEMKDPAKTTSFGSMLADLVEQYETVIKAFGGDDDKKKAIGEKDKQESFAEILVANMAG